MKRAAVAGLLVLAGATTLAAQSAAPAQPEAPKTAPDSPRAALQHYVDLCRSGDYESAASYLLLRPAQERRGADLARRLKAVLDRQLWIDLTALSGDADGDTSDGLAAGVDEIGTIALAGSQAPVRIVRIASGDPVAWAFSRETVGRIDGWYGALGDLWLRDRLPDSLLRPGPLDVAWWQWLSLPLIGALAWAAGRALGWTTTRVLARVTSRTFAGWDDVLVGAARGPIVLAWSVASAYPMMRSLSLYPPAEALATRVLGLLALASVVWAAWRAAGVIGAAMRQRPWASDNPSAQSALSIGITLTRAAILALGLVAALTQAGYPVGALLAGLGLGGLAFALAAQKTVENVFGSISLAADGPFRVGDFVKVEDFVGTVESIGLRSTRIRTLDRTLVTIPNGRLAEMRLESFSARDRMRLACTVGLVYETTAAQMRQVLHGLEAVLRQHPRIWPDAVVVRLKEFGPSSLDIEVMAWFESSWPEFQRIRQEVLLQFIEVVDRAGTSFAFPTRTVHVVGGRSEPQLPALAAGGAR